MLGDYNLHILRYVLCIMHGLVKVGKQCCYFYGQEACKQLEHALFIQMEEYFSAF